MSASSAMWRPLLFAYSGVLSFYLLVTFAASFHKSPVAWLEVWLGIVLTHLWYGVRFLQGLLFGRMPREVRSFDHGPGDSGA